MLTQLNILYKLHITINLNVAFLNTRVTIFSLLKRRTFFDNNYYQPYKLFCKAWKIFLNICWTLTAFDNYILIISTNTAVYFLNLLSQ